jgi:hypothetical protein
VIVEEAGVERAVWQQTRAQEALRRANEILRQAKVAEDAHQYRLSQAENLIAMYQEWRSAQEEGHLFLAGGCGLCGILGLSDISLSRAGCGGFCTGQAGFFTG